MSACYLTLLYSLGASLAPGLCVCSSLCTSLAPGVLVHLPVMSVLLLRCARLVPAPDPGVVVLVGVEEGDGGALMWRAVWGRVPSGDALPPGGCCMHW